MFSPPLYAVLKFPLNFVVSRNYNIQLTDEEIIQFKILQGDNMMFRQIRMISDDYDKFQKFVVFVDATGGQNKPNAVKHLIEHGFKINGKTFLFSERSASMVRQSMFSFVERHIEPELTKRISMELDFSNKPTVLSKYYAYRGLMLSSCHCLEDWYPKFVVVNDFYRIIPQQKIRYVYDKTMDFKDKNTGVEREWTQKAVAEKVQDVEINCFDGAGICHPSIMREFERRIGTDERMNSLILRAPYIKGCIHEIDYPTFFAERGVSSIKDIWGQTYDVTLNAEPLIIITVSMYKGLKYFKQDGTYKDWEHYWELFRKYHHCLGVAKWNFTFEQEPMITRCNYQLLQDLQLDFEDFKHLADTSVKWYENIVGGDINSTYSFLGLKADNCIPLNHYVAAIARNPELLIENCVREYLHNLLEKYRDEMKCGRLWMDATFKFFSPDLIALMEHIGGLPVVGCLKAHEFYSLDRRGVIMGERLLERNPHITWSEHNPCIGVNNELTKKYLSHLQNVLCINSYDISCQRLNGADQ